MSQSFIDKLKERWSKGNTFVCVGLDPDIEKIPQQCLASDHPLFAFNKAIVDATAEYVCAYKPQIAYYAASGSEEALRLTIEYIHDTYPHIPVILDAKRGDIGSTAQMYAKEAFDRYKADGVTVNPYMGGDTLMPFLERADKGVVILCKTSNPGSGDLQDVRCDGQELYKRVATLAHTQWNTKGNVVLVIGATYPEEIGAIRKITPTIPFLVPGVGAQGGDVQKVIQQGCTSEGDGLIINSSRGIIYASKEDGFADAAGRAAKELRDTINNYR